MTSQLAALQRAAASGGALAVLGCGLALYQLTTLGLGPQGSRQLPLSVSLPALEGQESMDPIQARPSVILGSRLTAAPANRPAMATTVVTYHAAPTASRAAVATVTVAQRAAVVAPTSVPKPQPLPSVKPIVPLPAERDAHEGETATTATGSHLHETRDRD